MTMIRTALAAASGLALGAALIGPAAAQTFGGMPTVTPQAEYAKKKNQAKKAEEKEDERPSYVVVDKGGRQGYTSIQEAVDAVAWGGVVVVMPGLYEENIELSKAVSIQGDRGPGAGVRVVPASGSKPCLSYSPINFNDHAMISNLQFYPAATAPATERARAINAGAYNAASTESCIKVDGGVFTMMESTVDGAGRHGGTLVEILGGTALLEKNTITGGQRGVVVDQDHALWDRAFLVDNVVSGNDRAGIHLAGVSSMLATGNLINANQEGLVYNGHGDATVVGNKILDNRSHGIELGREGQQVLLRLNQIWSNKGDGVKVFSSAGLIEDNDIDGNIGFEINTLEHTGNVPRYYNDIEANVKAKPGKKRRR